MSIVCTRGALGHLRLAVLILFTSGAAQGALAPWTVRQTPIKLAWPALIELVPDSRSIPLAIVDATAESRQVGYSIDGGETWELHLPDRLFTPGAAGIDGRVAAAATNHQAMHLYDFRTRRTETVVVPQVSPETVVVGDGYWVVIGTNRWSAVSDRYWPEFQWRVGPMSGLTKEAILEVRKLGRSGLVALTVEKPSPADPHSVRLWVASTQDPFNWNRRGDGLTLPLFAGTDFYIRGCYIWSSLDRSGMTRVFVNVGETQKPDGSGEFTVYECTANGFVPRVRPTAGTGHLSIVATRRGHWFFPSMQGIEHVQPNKSRNVEELFVGQTLWIVEEPNRIALRALSADRSGSGESKVSAYASSWIDAPPGRVTVARSSPGLDLRADGFEAGEAVVFETSSDLSIWSELARAIADTTGRAHVFLPESETLRQSSRLIRARQ